MRKSNLFVTGTIFLFGICGIAHAQTSNGSIQSSASNQVYVLGGQTNGGSREVVESRGPGGLPAGTAGMSAPYIMSANPCALENGGSLVYGPLAGSIATSHVEHGCALVRDAGAVNAVGESGTSLVVLCEQESTAFAFFHEWGLLCPGTRNPEKYKLEDLGIQGISGRPVVAIVSPYNGKILNASQSPILGAYLQQQAPQVVAMDPVVNPDDKKKAAKNVALSWQRRMEQGSLPLPGR